MIALLMISCAPVEQEKQLGSWQLVWEDQFEGEANAPLDSAKWSYDIGGDGWGNNQLEFDTDRIENVRLSGNSTMEIVARREDYQGNEYTSARIKTQDLFEDGYGRYEARIKLPKGQGVWPAFWLLGASFGDGDSWPSCGEIDILEMRGDDPNTIAGTIHGPGYSGGDSIGGEVTSDTPYSDDFHVYRLDFDEQHLTWYIDDVPYLVLNPGDLPSGTSWVFDDEYFIILNVAVGGNYLENPEADTPFPNTMEVDYVKVFSRAE